VKSAAFTAPGATSLALNRIGTVGWFNLHLIANLTASRPARAILFLFSPILLSKHIYMDSISSFIHSFQMTKGEWPARRCRNASCSCHAPRRYT
jgi:hypothetical protein